MGSHLPRDPVGGIADAVFAEQLEYPNHALMGIHAHDTRLVGCLFIRDKREYCQRMVSR